MKAPDDFFIPDNEVWLPEELDYGRVECGNKSYLSSFISLVFVSILLCCCPINATNIVTYTVSDSLVNQSERLEMRFRSISNANDKVRISFELKSANAPFTIYKANWINCDSVFEPLEPFSLIAQTDEVTGKSTEWHISLDFPLRDSFTENDVLVLDTDKGIVRCPTSMEGVLKETIDILRIDYEKQLDQSKEKSRNLWMISAIILSCVIIASCIIFTIGRRRLIRKRQEIEELSMLITERTERNKELEAKVDALYGSRLDTLNMLCNEYFEKNESEKVRLTLYNEVEKHILALRDSKSIEELEKIVNSYLDNILSRVKEQLPELNRKDLIFLTYLYAGFSPRAICIFTDMKIKNFYNRRSRLKDRILASKAPDRGYFASKI